MSGDLRESKTSRYLNCMRPTGVPSPASHLVLPSTTRSFQISEHRASSKPWASPHMRCRIQGNWPVLSHAHLHPLFSPPGAPNWSHCLRIDFSFVSCSTHWFSPLWHHVTSPLDFPFLSWVCVQGPSVQWQRSEHSLLFRNCVVFRCHMPPLHLVAWGMSPCLCWIML